MKRQENIGLDFPTGVPDAQASWCTLFAPLSEVVLFQRYSNPSDASTTRQREVMGVELEVERRLGDPIAATLGDMAATPATPAAPALPTGKGVSFCTCGCSAHTRTSTSGPTSSSWPLRSMLIRVPYDTSRW